MAGKVCRGTAHARILGLIIFAVLAAAICLMSQPHLEKKLIYLQLDSNLEEFKNIVGELDSTYRRAAVEVLDADRLFIVGYWSLVALMVYVLFRSSGPTRKVLLLTALQAITLTAGFDVGENNHLREILIPKSPEDISQPDLEELGYWSMAKWAAFFVSLALLASGFLGRGRWVPLFCGACLVISAIGIVALLPELSTAGIRIALAATMVLATALLFVLIVFPSELTRIGRKREPDPIFKKAVPLVFAHRGGAEETAESTWEGFCWAVQNHADVLELDLQLTQDDHLVVWHGPKLDKVWLGHLDDCMKADPKARRPPENNDIRHQRWADLNGNTWVRKEGESLQDAPQHPKDRKDRELMTLEELLARLDSEKKFEGVPVNIELKTRFYRGSFWTGDVEPLLEIIQGHLKHRKFLLTSFSWILLRRLRRESKKRQLTGLSFGSSLLQVVLTPLAVLLGLIPLFSLRNRALQAPHCRLLSPRFAIDAVQEAGGAFHVFLTGFTRLPCLKSLESGSDSPTRKQVQEILDRGVHGLMTDRPQRLRPLIT